MRRGESWPPEPLLLLTMVRGRGFHVDGKHNTNAPMTHLFGGQMVLAGVPGRRSSGSEPFRKV